MSIATAFRAYSTSPSTAGLRRLHQEITRSPDFERATTWLPRAQDLMAQERYDEVIRLIMERMPGLVMSPTAHSLLSIAYGEIGDREQSRREAYYTDLAITAIIDSGAGTPTSPWTVLHVADEYAALQHLGLRPVAQASEGDEQVLDTIECSDGSQKWFRFA